MGLLKGTKTEKIENFVVPCDGKVHVEIKQVSFTSLGAAAGSGTAIDKFMSDIQDQGAEIMDVTCYVVNDNYVQAVIVYRAPK